MMAGRGIGIENPQRKALLDLALRKVAANPYGGLREQMRSEDQAENAAYNDEFRATASNRAQANAAMTPEGRLYSTVDNPNGMNAVPTTMQDDMAAQQFGVSSGAKNYAQMWNYARDRANAAGGKAQIKDDRETFGTAEDPLRMLRNMRNSGVYT